MTRKRWMLCLLVGSASGCPSGNCEGRVQVPYAGCDTTFQSSEDELENTQVTLDNLGVACVIEASETATVEVTLSSCEAPCGVTDVQTGCVVQQVGARLEIEAWAEYTRHATNDICEPSCLELVATCSSEPLAPSSYTLVYDGDEATQAVPDGVFACAGTDL